MIMKRNTYERTASIILLLFYGVLEEAHVQLYDMFTLYMLFYFCDGGSRKNNKETMKYFVEN